MRYVRAKIDDYQIDLAYRIYVSDSLFYMADNKRLTSRYYDLIHTQKETLSGDEIALDVIKRLGLKVKENECI